MDELEKLVFGDAGIHERIGNEGETSPAEDAPIEEEITSESRKRAQPTAAPAAWHDADDDDVEVDLVASTRARKLRRSKRERVVTGAEYATRLREQFAKLHQAPAWARTAATAASAAVGAGEADEETDAVLRSTRSLLASGDGSAASRGPLPTDRLRIQRQKDLNQHAVSKAMVQSIDFAADGATAFTAGLDKTVRIFSVDGIENPKVHGIHLSDLPMTSAAYLTGPRTEIACSGRRRYFYTIDVETGRASKVARVEGRAEKSLEKMVVSPCGKYICFLGNAGSLLLVSQQTKRWVATVKANAAVAAAAFSADGQDLFATGHEGEVYRWDLRTRKCLARHQDEGSSAGTAIGVSPTGRYYAVGADSGVVNVYDTRADDVMAGAPAPTPTKAVMALQTRPNIVKFSPDGALLTVASFAEKDSLRMVHVPSFSTYGNWPTERTPLSRVTAAAFSPNTGYFATGNDKGKALLYRLHHYDQA